MTEEQIEAVRMVRVEADNLRMACIAAAETSALLHVAYDQGIVEKLPLDQAMLIGALGGIN
jgi:hypothetical protein